MSFITFEGGEGVGKTTLIERLFAELSTRAPPLLKTRAPGSTTAGAVIRDLVLHHDEPLSARAELLLYLADRAEHVAKVIRPALERGETVLCDRYHDSTIAYQGVGRGLDPAYVRDLCTFSSGSLWPSLTLYLDLDPVLGLERVRRAGAAADKIESEQILFHQKIRMAFLSFARAEPERFKVVDASRPPEEVFSQAMELIAYVRRA